MQRRLSRERQLSGRAWARLLFTGFMLFAFLMQSNATQTHIHVLLGQPEAAVAKLLLTADAPGPVKKDTGKDSSDDCPLCQLLYGGQYVAPSTLIFFLPMMAVSTIETVLGVTPHYDSVSHSWHGRAPPQA